MRCCTPKSDCKTRNHLAATLSYGLPVCTASIFARDLYPMSICDRCQWLRSEAPLPEAIMACMLLHYQTPSDKGGAGTGKKCWKGAFPVAARHDERQCSKWYCRVNHTETLSGQMRVRFLGPSTKCASPKMARCSPTAVVAGSVGWYNHRWLH